MRNRLVVGTQIYDRPWPLLRGSIEVMSSCVTFEVEYIGNYRSFLVPVPRKAYPAYQNGHVTDDVAWPSRVKLVTPIRLERNMSKTTGDRNSVPKVYQSKWHGLSNGHLTYDVTSPVLWGSRVGYPSDSLTSFFGKIYKSLKVWNYQRCDCSLNSITYTFSRYAPVIDWFASDIEIMFWLIDWLID